MVGILGGVVVGVDGDPGGSGDLAHPVDGAGGQETLVGDQHDALQAELGEVHRKAGDRAGTVVHPRRALEEVNAVPGHQSRSGGAGGGAVDARSISAGGELSSTSRARGSRHLLEQRVDGCDAELVVIAAERRLRRLEEIEHRIVVGRDHRDVARDVRARGRGSRRSHRRPG